MKRKQINKIMKDMAKELGVNVYDESNAKVIYKHTKKAIEYVQYEKFKTQIKDGGL